MKTRTLLAAALVVPMCLGVTNASATTKKKKPPAKKPTCNLIKDGPGDATLDPNGNPTMPNDPSLDIVGGDFATNASTMTVSIKLAATDNTVQGAGNSSQVGRVYRLFFTVRGDTRSLDVGIVPIADGFSHPELDSWPTGAFAQSIDTVNHVIKFSVPISTLPGPQPKVNEKISNLTVTSWRGLGAKNTLGKVDTGAATVAYASAWPSCMKVGA
jgi:hypothetical protein